MLKTRYRTWALWIFQNKAQWIPDDHLMKPESKSALYTVTLNQSKSVQREDSRKLLDQSGTFIRYTSCVSFRRLRPPEVSFEGCIRHWGGLILEKQVGHTECDLRMRPSFTGIRRMHQVYPSLLQITNNSLRHHKQPSLIWKMPAPADVHTSADVVFSTYLKLPPVKTDTLCS